MSGISRNTNYSRARVILFLGAPGSGKGTQSAWLSARLGIPSLSTGDLLRAEASRNTLSALKLRRTLASGKLVSDSMVCNAVRTRLERELPSNGIILDGFPRTVAQAECLDQILGQMGLPGPLVLHLDVSREPLIRRLTSRRQCPSCKAIYNLISRPSSKGDLCENDGTALAQREDDTESTIVRRFTEFDLACAPLVEYYSAADYHRIDGDRDPELISAELLDIAALQQERAAA